MKPTAPRRGLARVISKLGLGSRTQAAQWVRDGRVRVNGKPVRDAQYPVAQGVDRISLDEVDVEAQQRLVIVLNKPRGLVTSVHDERGRATVYTCFEGSVLPWLAPIGRLDKASEGMLLFSNDPAWAARVADPTFGPDKRYHVQIDRLPSAELLEELRRGATVDGERLSAKAISILRRGEKNGWLEISLAEGRNRHIRRLLEAFDVGVLRLVRVAIGTVNLGTLAKGEWRALSAQEMHALVPVEPDVIADAQFNT